MGVGQGEKKESKKIKPVYFISYIYAAVAYNILYLLK
jgi:hypothetical protein